MKRTSKRAVVKQALPRGFALLILTQGLGQRLASADIVVDNFNNGNYSLSISAPANPVGTVVSTNLTGLAGTLGGSRNVSLRLDSGTSGSVSSVTSLGFGTLGEDVGMSGTVSFTYNANGAGLGNLDLTQGGALNKFRLNLFIADNVAQFRIDVIDGLTTASYTTNFGTLALNVNLDFPFVLFSNQSALLSADQIRLTIIGVPAGDYIINNFLVVPEAGTTGAVVAGAAGLGTWWIRRRRSPVESGKSAAAVAVE